MFFWILLILTALLSFALTQILRRYALSRSMVDIPNSRSSHLIPTPRGGGIAFVVSFLGILCLLTLTDIVPWNLCLALLGAGGGIAFLGFLDDRGHVAARLRLTTHFAAAVWVLYWLNGMPSPVFFGWTMAWGWAGTAFGLLYLVWTLNLYNFMDGIDGIAGMEALFISTGGALLYLFSGHPSHAILPLFLGASVLGFLFWNYPPAKIFMGDAGSGFLGIILGILALHAAWTDFHLFWGWLILFGIFIVDATLTLLRRLLYRKKIHRPHRSHAYQYAARHFGGHRPVLLAVAGINLFWLFPMAILAGAQVLEGIFAVGIAYAPLILLAWHFKAGAEHLQTR
jgi:Fuc2NAc and GlcNAc transferase